MNLEDRLRRSFDNLDGALADVPLGRFEPPQNRGGRRTAAAVAVVILAGLALYVGTRSEAVSKLDTAVPPRTVPTTVAPNPGPAATVVVEPENPGDAYVPVNPGAGAWNADGSAALLYRRGGGYLVVDPDGSPTAELDILAQDIEQVYWDPTDPTTIWFPPSGTNTLASVDALSGQVSTDLITIDDCSTIEAGSLVGPNPMLADDGRSVFGLTCEQPDGRREASVELRLIELPSGEQIGSRPVSVGGSIALSRSGRFGVVHTEGTLSVFDARFENEVFSVELEPEFALVDNEELGEVVVGRRYDGESIGALLVIDLATGTERSIIGLGLGHGHPPPGLRMAASPDGVVALRVPTDAVVDSGDLLQPGNIYVIDLAETEPVVRLAATSVNSADNEDLDVWFRGHLSVNRSGTALGFSSDLATANADRVSTVIIPLPER